MESPTPMTHEELLEQAALDALGLLDQYESSLFTRSFHRATATVQKQIVEFQAELAADESLLPDEAPPADLRERVLGAMAQAVESQEADFAPLASIRGGRVDRPVEPAVATVSSPRSTLIFWRAAVLVLTVGLVFTSYFAVHAYQTGNKIAMLAVSDNTRQEFESALGPKFAEFVSHPAVRTIRFSSPDAEFEGSVTVYLNDLTREAFVVALSLPRSDERYSIHAGSGNSTKKLQSFDVNNPIVGVHLTDVSSTTMASTSWSIRDGKGVAVLQSS